MKPTLIILSVLISCLLYGYSVADDELPLLGENASLNLLKEDKLGRGLYLRLKDKGYVVDDPLLSRYLSDIGESLLTSLDIRLRDYNFYLVKDSSVNAFATPGGYIGINVGLINMTRTEDELASVLAHEIAHVELMHSMQMLEKAQDVNMAGMISMLAAILIGVGGNSPDLAGALIYSGAAGSAQAMINFTRANEYEADRVGIGLLQKSDYEPAAMADFMKLLQLREQTGALSNIEYIRTHPVNSNRIAEILSRVQNTDKKPLKFRRYKQFKDYLFYLHPQNVVSSQKSQFFQSLELTRNGQYAKAEKQYLELISTDPDSLWYSYALAENLEFQQRLDDAVKLYRSMLLLYPEDFAMAVRLIKILIRKGSLEQALEMISGLIEKNEKQVLGYQLQEEVYRKLESEPLRQLAEANYHWFSGNKERAVKLFEAVLAQGSLDAANEEKVKEKLILK